MGRGGGITPKEAEIKWLKQENAQLKQENAQLKQENAQAALGRQAAENTIRRAKDPTPVKRPGFGRVSKLVSDACMSLERIKCGWILSLGKRECFFRRLREIWELLIQEDWSLSDILPSTPTNPEKPPRLKGGYCDLSDRPEPQTPAPTPAPAPTSAPTSAPIRKTSHQVDRHTPHHPADIEVLRAQWRLFPQARALLEEEAARLGIKLVPT